MTPEQRTLVEIVEAIDNKLPADMTHMDWQDADAAAMTVIRWLEIEHGARYRNAGQEYRLRLGGFSVSCTSSKSGLLRNWQTNARNRLKREGVPA